MDYDRRVVTYILTADQLIAIGSVAVESTFCEQLVESLIWELLRLTERHGKFLTAGRQMESRIELLKDIGKTRLRSKKQIAEFTALISRLKIANNSRNIIIHGSWETQGESVMRVLMDGPEKHKPAVATKRRPNSEPATWNADGVEQVALDIANVSTDLLSFARRVWKIEP